jgi:hypothetical protein
LSSVTPSTSGIQMSSSTRSGAALAHLPRLGGVLGQLDRVPLVGEDLGQQGPDAELVVDYQNGCHAS